MLKSTVNLNKTN